MAMFQCPECGNMISSYAEVCPSCGFPIRPYIQEKEYNDEIKRLTEKIKPTKFTCKEPRVMVCIKCGRAFSYWEGEQEARPSCGCELNGKKYPGVEVDYYTAGRSFCDREICPPYDNKMSMDKYDLMRLCTGIARELYIYEQCVVPRNIGDEDSQEYKDRKEVLYEVIEEYERDSNTKITPLPPDNTLDLAPWLKPNYVEPPKQVYIPREEPKNVPTCPICKSTSLTKLSGTKKAAKILAFGIFGMGDNGKTWKCNKCGSKF